MNAPLEPTLEEQTSTTVVGYYRSVTGSGPNDFYRTPIYGIREWKFGPQVLVNSIGGRAWINGSACDIQTVRGAARREERFGGL